MAITLDQAQTQLDAWLAASTAVASGQSYSIQVEGNTRSLTRANAAEIQNMVTFWEGKVNSLTRSASGRSRTRYFVR